MSERRLRIAYLSENEVLPPDDGAKIRNQHLIRGLAREHDVTLILSCRQTPQELERLRTTLNVTPLAVPKPPHRYASYLRRMATGVPFDLALYTNAAAARWLRRNRDRLDVVLAGSVTQGLNVPWTDGDGPPMVVDTHNLDWIRHEREVRDQPDLRSRAIKWARGLGTRRFELAQLRRAARVLVCSEVEREILAAHGVHAVEVVPNGVDTASAEPGSDSAGGAPVVLFPGNLAYPPNDAAAEWLLREIAPLLRQMRPDLQVLVAGRDASPRLRSLAESSPARLRSPVPDMGELFARSTVVVVPLRTGGGTRIKILEAFGFGRAVVSTRIGAEGLAVNDGEHLLLAEDTEEIARAVIRVADDAALRERLGRAGRRLVEERYDWSAIGRGLSSDLRRWTSRAKERT